MLFDKSLLAYTHELAERALEEGERPVAALLVLHGNMVAESTDAVFKNTDPTAHAERMVISKYTTHRKKIKLPEYELYCFIEPCIMCCGAIHWAKIGKVVYSLSQDRLKKLSGGKKKPGIRDYLPLGGASVTIVGPAIENEAFEIASRYAW